jgi:hypothetical protein
MRALTVRDAFQEYVEGKDGKLRHLPVRMIVQSEFEDRKRDWQHQIKALCSRSHALRALVPTLCVGTRMPSFPRSAWERAGREALRP